MTDCSITGTASLTDKFVSFLQSLKTKTIETKVFEITEEVLTLSLRPQYDDVTMESRLWFPRIRIIVNLLKTLFTTTRVYSFHETYR